MGSLKTLLGISLAANLGLLGWMLMTPSGSAPPAPQFAGLPAVPEAGSSPKPVPQPVRSGFQWGEVESADYRVYVANLRGIHCPEPTIRDIITADVAALFARQRDTDPSAALWSRQREQELIAALLEVGAPRTGAGAGPQPTDYSLMRPARVPLLYRAQSLASLRLSEEQQQELADLASQFIADIGGTNQDPRDPAYLERWRKAQARADEQIVTTIGRRALVDLDQAAPSEEPGDE